MQKILLLSIILFFTACGSKYSKVSTEPSAIYQPPRSNVVYSEHLPIPSKRIITKRAYIKVEVDNITKAQKLLTSIIEKSRGHILNARIYEDSYNASAKVPAQNLKSTLDNIAKLGDKISQTISQDDVTSQFIDYQARLKNLILLRDKMQKLLNQTTKIEEILKIERELGRIQTEIDSIQGHLKYLKDAVVFSPIDINLEEKTIYGPLGYVVHGIWWVTKKLFVIR